MIWSHRMRQGAGLTTIGTIIATALSILYLWFRPEAAAISTWDFAKMAFVVVLVWTLIGITMGIFIVMILRKNERIERGD